MQVAFELAFERFRDRYHEMLERCLHHRAAFLWGFVAVCVGSFVLLVPWLGRDFFPKVDAGQFKLHVRARAGTRIEETASLCDRIEAFIREQIPPHEISSIIDNIGLPYSSINLSYSNSAPTGPADADILVTLNTGPSADGRICPRFALEAARRVSRRGFFFSAGGHCQPDSELRSSRSD